MGRVCHTERNLKKFMRETGRPFDIKQGSKHKHIYFDGVFIGVLSNYENGQDTKNLEAKVRRVLEKA
jgi:hypothetical protein